MKTGKIRIRISSHESVAPVQLKITPPEGVDINCTYYDTEERSRQRQEVNVLNDYYDAYRKAYRRIAIKKIDIGKSRDCPKVLLNQEDL